MFYINNGERFRRSPKTEIVSGLFDSCAQLSVGFVRGWREFVAIRANRITLQIFGIVS